MSATTLTPSQIDALFDILTHHATYAEIQAYAWPDAIEDFGHPFTEMGAQSSSPILNMLVNGFITKQPGINSLPSDFWQARLGVIVSNVGGAGLSESYDKGAMGTRKTLATASATLLEYVARGYVRGYARDQNMDPDRNYDLDKAEHLMRAWEDAAQGLVYGDLMDDFLDQMAESDRLVDKSPVFQATIEYILIW
jgi:PX-associated